MLPLIIANWKMALGLGDSLKLTEDLLRKYFRTNLELVICPSFVSLFSVGRLIAKSSLKLGAQDVAATERGSYTGEIAAVDLAELGCKYVIVGHSERRRLGENDELVRAKIVEIIKCGLTPILCVGENSEEHGAGLTEDVVIRQLSRGLSGVNLNSKKIVIAYEPTWAIGSGISCSPVEAEHVARVIYEVLRDLPRSASIEENLRIIYGGSVTKDNICNYLEMEHLSGAIIGGASQNFIHFNELLSQLC